MTQRERTCCFTGHRYIPAEHYEPLKKRLRDTIQFLTGRGVRYYGAGGALGFDTLAAQCVLEYRDYDPNIKLILVLPCYSQAQKWDAKDRLVYGEIKARADKVVYTAAEYTRGCMFTRNRHLVECSGVCVCYLTKGNGGTAYTVDYARQRGLEIIDLAGCLGER